MCLLMLGVNGLNDSAFMTGTGVQATFGCSLQDYVVDNDDYNDWTAFVQELKVKVNGETATVYPLSTDDVVNNPVQGVWRNVRFDSTMVEGSLLGVPQTITIEAKFRFELWQPLPYFPWEELVDVDWQTFTMPVTPKAFNVGLASAADVNSPGSPGAGWVFTVVPEEFTWKKVSQDMADMAKTKLTAANYANIADKLFLKTALLIDPLADPPENPINKLLGQSTSFFNSSHGAPSGFGDKDSYLTTHAGWMTWSQIGGTTGSGIINLTGLLANRFTWLYSCECGSGTSPQGAFHIGGDNMALFGFSHSVFSTLKAGDLSELVDYNSGSTLIMTDKLTLHVEKMLEDLATGWTANDAKDRAHSQYPPRKYNTSQGGVNKMGLCPMTLGGDGEAKLHEIYRKSTETDDLWVQYGDWALVGRPIVPMPNWPSGGGGGGGGA